MSKKNRKYREHWYSGITEAIQMYIPGNKLYHTMPARRARTGTLFILPFIIGFIFRFSFDRSKSFCKGSFGELLQR